MAVTKHVYLGIYWMAMINTTINPLIYFWMNNKFRNYFLKAILFIPRIFLGKDCCQQAGVTPPVTQAGNMSQRNSMRQIRSFSQRSTNTTTTRVSVQ